MNKKYILIFLLSFFAGILFFAFYNEMIIFRWPYYKYEDVHLKKAQTQFVTLYWWQNNKWNTEKVEVLRFDDIPNTSYNILISWLNAVEEEKATGKKISLESVILDSTQNELYVSFTRNPFDKQSSTYNKWMFIEGILKTLRENNIKVNGVHFLAHHQPIQDFHLDFSKTWPIEGMTN
ncbi:hypothetical protein M1446_03820 [Candidatus Dependentiae bacterium]|nr:hypothetical protein [Candidatus Dependentiae bacterium]